MKKITQELIEAHLGKQKGIKPLWSGGYFVDLESGASVTITRKGIDFGKYKEIENRGDDVEEWMFQVEVQDCLALGNEIWGGIGVYGKGKPEDRAAMLEYAASVGIETGDQGLLLRHFGAEATFKHGWFGEWAINLPNGSAVKISGNAIEEVRGGGDVFRSALMLINEIAPDNVVVRGKPAFVLMGINHGKALNIEVIPESDLASFYGITSSVVQIACSAVGCIWLDLWIAIVSGYCVGLLLCMAAGGVFWKQIRSLARKRGRKMIGLEATDNNTRKASLADARSKGML